MATLVESELFGYTRGAFTGAMQAKQGLMESANGGSLFLDEIGEMSLEMQAKLLRARQQKEVKPVGSTERRAINVRIARSAPLSASVTGSKRWTPCLCATSMR